LFAGVLVSLNFINPVFNRQFMAVATKNLFTFYFINVLSIYE